MEIWANSLLPKALKTCPKSNKSHNLATLNLRLNAREFQFTCKFDFSISSFFFFARNRLGPSFLFDRFDVESRPTVRRPSQAHANT